MTRIKSARKKAVTGDWRDRPREIMNGHVVMLKRLDLIYEKKHC